jgi:hypothetical protein
VNDCSVYVVLLCDVVCFHGQTKRLEECAPPLFRLEEEGCKLLQNVWLFKCTASRLRK